MFHEQNPVQCKVNEFCQVVTLTAKFQGSRKKREFSKRKLVPFEVAFESMSGLLLKMYILRQIN